MKIGGLEEMLAERQELIDQLREDVPFLLGGNIEDFNKILRSVIKYPVTLENYASLSVALAVLKTHRVNDKRIVIALWDLVALLIMDLEEVEKIVKDIDLGE